VLRRFSPIHEVGTVTHQVFDTALAASTNGYARVFVRQKVECIVATFASDIGEVVNRIRIPIAVASQFGANVRVIVTVPVFATLH
jgi:hypothetical protein